MAKLRAVIVYDTEKGTTSATYPDGIRGLPGSRIAGMERALRVAYRAANVEIQNKDTEAREKRQAALAHQEEIERTTKEAVRHNSKAQVAREKLEALKASTDRRV